MPGEGVEPSKACAHWILNPARLPIPPPGQVRLKTKLQNGGGGGIRTHGPQKADTAFPMPPVRPLRHPTKYKQLWKENSTKTKQNLLLTKF